MAKLGELYASKFDVGDLAFAYHDRRVLVKILDLWWAVRRRSVWKNKRSRSKAVASMMKFYKVHKGSKALSNRTRKGWVTRREALCG